MAHAISITNVVAQARLTALKTSIDAGTAAIIRIYDGTQAADADTAVGAQVLLAQLTMSATAFGSVSDAAPGAIMTAASITSDSDADATGTATWFRMLDQSGGNTIMDGTVGTSGCDLNLNTTSIVQHSTVSISSMTITERES